MAVLNTAFQAQRPGWIPTLNNAVRLRFGVREINIHKYFQNRFYRTNSFIEFRAGVNAGHVEILLLRSWKIVFSKAQC